MGKTETEEKYQTTIPRRRVLLEMLNFLSWSRYSLHFVEKEVVLPCDLFLSWTRSIQLTFISHFLKIRFFPSMSRLSKSSLALTSRHQNAVCPFPLSHTRHEPQHKSASCSNVREIKMSCSSLHIFPLWGWRAEFHDLGYGIWVGVSTTEVGLISTEFCSFSVISHTKMQLKCNVKSLP